MFDNAPVWVPPLVFAASFAAVMVTFLMSDKSKSKSQSDSESSRSEDVTSTGQSGGQTGQIVQSVTSHNQTGGITAHTVNVDSRPPQRRLDDALLQDIMSRINAETVVSISYPMGDGEAATLAREIYETLKSKGVRFADYLACMAAVFENPPVGLVAERGEDDRSLHIVVGRNTG